MIHKKDVCKYIWPRIVKQGRTSIWLMRRTYPIRPTEGFCIKLVILVNLNINGYRGHQNCKCIYFATYLANWEVYFPNPGPWILHTPLVPVELSKYCRAFFLKNEATVRQYLHYTVRCMPINVVGMQPLWWVGRVGWSTRPVDWCCPFVTCRLRCSCRCICVRARPFKRSDQAMFCVAVERRFVYLE